MFSIPNPRRYMFLKIPLRSLYDKYIDRPKLSELKKPFEYIVPPSALKWGFGTIKQLAPLTLRLNGYKWNCLKITYEMDLISVKT